MTPLPIPTPSSSTNSTTPNLSPDFAMGDASRFGIYFRSFTLHDGTEVCTPRDGITVLVGGNNCGKSTILRQLHYRAMAQPLHQEHVELVTGVRAEREGTSEDLLAWLYQHADLRTKPNLGQVFSRPQGSDVSPGQAASQWQHENPESFGIMAGYFLHYSRATNRTAGQVQQREDVSEPPSHPLHLLQDDTELLQQLNLLIQDILGEQLTLDDLSGSMKLRIGAPDARVPLRNEGQREYRRAMATLPLLSQQGDGVQSLVGLLVPLVTSTFPIIVVDEPEAFLHPPQSRALGKALGHIAAQTHTQIILATHDRNLLTGLMSSGAPLSVVRVNRQVDQTRAYQLPAESLGELWSDPVLRYSSVLDGLFYQLVVIAEAEQDCRFYSAALDFLTSSEDSSGAKLVPQTDVLFVPSGGKSAMPKLAAALRAVKVPLVVTPDLDILRDTETLRRLLETLDADWATVGADLERCTQDIRSSLAPSLATVTYRLEAALKQANEARDGSLPMDRDVRAILLSEIRASHDRWQQLKEYGVAAFRGEARVTANRLLDNLDSAGIVPVRVGELERFAPDLGISKGKRWLPTALQAQAYRSENVQEHLQHILRHLPAPSPR